MAPMERRPVLILDFGSQYTQLIARRIREQRVYCEIHPCTLPLERMRALAPVAVVLSGGPQSVYEPGAPSVDAGVFELGVPVLGMLRHALTVASRGVVERAEKREYGPARIEVQAGEALFDGFKAGDKVDVWMSHGDSVKALPRGFRTLANTSSTPFAAIYDETRRFVCVQFHPEVVHTDRGAD